MRMLNKGKIYSFGCSFSTKNFLPKEMFWLYKLAKFYKVEYEAWGNGATEYHEAFHRLSWSMKNFKKGDLVIFQFTDTNRIGLINSKTNKYFTTASITDENHDYFIKKTTHILGHGKFKDKNVEDTLKIFEWSNDWAEYQTYYHYWMVWNLLSYLKESVGVDFILLFLNQRWSEVIQPEHYDHIPMFKIPTNRKNIALGRWTWEMKYSVGHELKYSMLPEWHAKDGHLGDVGNTMLTSNIIQHIFSKWDETNPWTHI